MKKYFIEFIGTFFLLLIIALSGSPLAIGVGLTALVYMGGYISGAHYNPAVTVALWINKKITAYAAIHYIAVQLFAGIVAAGVYFFIQNKLFIPAAGEHVHIFSALVVEILFTFLLASVVLHVAATEKTKGNNYFGLAIGFTVMAAVFSGGAISGGVFNPAVGIGPLLFDITNIAHHATSICIYTFGPLLGGILAGFVYKLVSAKN